MANIVGLPGLGSLAAGRRSGYIQMALSLVGLALTTAFGIRFVLWYVAHSAELNRLDDQMGSGLGEIIQHMGGAFLGIAVFLLGWTWALLTGLAIVAAAKSSESKPIPPLIKP